MLTTSVVVLDFETTGLAPGSRRITEVAALRLDGTRVVDRYVTLVNAGVPIPAATAAFNGISNDLIANAPPARTVVRRLVEFIGADIVVAHAAGFERAVLAAECCLAGLQVDSLEMLCTMLLARRLAPDLANHKLATVAEHVGVRFCGNPHRAEPDAQATADVLLKFAGQIVGAHPIAAVEPRLLQQITRWPVHDVQNRLRQSLARPVMRRPLTEGRAAEPRPLDSRFPGAAPWSGNRREPGSTSAATSALARALPEVPAPTLSWQNRPVPSVTEWSTRTTRHDSSRKRRPAEVTAEGSSQRPGSATSAAAPPDRPWLLDRANGRLVHRASGLTLGPSEYRYENWSPAVIGYATSHPSHRWIRAVDVEVN